MTQRKKLRDLARQHRPSPNPNPNPNPNPKHKPRDSADADADATNEFVTDDRFAKMYTAPLFKKFKNKDQKIKIDQRFAGVLNDDRFSVATAKYDKYGRKIKRSKNQAAELQEFYTIEEDDDNAKHEAIEQVRESVDQSFEERLDYLNKLSRGEISGSSSDSDRQESDAEEDDEEDEAAEQMSADEPSLYQLEETPPPVGEATRRLAILHCDWQHVRAVDLFALLQSFCPTGYRVRRVSIYLSDFGKEQLAIEERYGPQGIWSHNDGTDEAPQENDDDDDDDDDQNDDGNFSVEESENGDDDDDNEEKEQNDHDEGFPDEAEDSTTKEGMIRRAPGQVGIVLEGDGAGGLNELELRRYELLKLRYYFAIAECDEISTANILYTALDQMEFEHSSVAIDLRFVPDDVMFNGREVKETCNHIPADYEPPDFITVAIQHTNVKCTWDEPEEDRSKKLTNFSRWRDLKESDLQVFLASDSESSHDEGENDKLRKKLLGDDNEGDDNVAVGDDPFFANDNGKVKAEEEGAVMEFTYTPSLGKDILERKVQKERLEKETPQEALARQRKERKARKLQNLATDQRDDNDESHIPENNEDVGDADGSRSQPFGEHDGDAEDDDEDLLDYDVQMLVKAQKQQRKNLKGKRKRLAEAAAAAANTGFEVDVQDPRFSALFEGDDRFGIDTTSKTYKDTEGMRTILTEQQTRRTKSGKNLKAPPTESGDSAAGFDQVSTPDVAELVARAVRLKNTGKKRSKNSV